ncbi:hypothetical protein [Thiorhodococcus minor]|uniref:Uncharacterized protein n=1 Tax=Thiorhodococcus minor TaxID=57489 RepID=A0A6M0K463_9GAMM|nr:hypothetical protein [Thiorhodococcus minor]NEV63387.1 hypothetical protein [Thiorhodococcus minor]
MTDNHIVQKLWSLCDVLRDDGINYSNYVTELVLQEVHERAQAGCRETGHPQVGQDKWPWLDQFRWPLTVTEPESQVNARRDQLGSKEIDRKTSGASAQHR